MTQKYSICEPHPSVPSRGRSAYIQAGRGGAGNIKRYEAAQLTQGPSASGPASRTELSPPPTNARFTSGRGGAGNTFSRQESQRAIFSFDEELRREAMIKENMSKTPVYHIGRGGAGNLVNEMEPKPSSRQGSDASVSSSGSSTSERARRGFGDMFRTLSRSISK